MNSPNHATDDTNHVTQTTAIVVDDEEHVRTRIVELLNRFASISVIGECGNGVEAVEMIADLRPKLAFLDIQMPLLDGFDVIHAVEPSDLPVVVFVTAFDEHAIKAFDVNAVDYVLKPIDEKRFTTAVIRSLKRVGENRGNHCSEQTVSASVNSSLKRPCRRLLVKKLDSHIVVNTREVEWIEAADKYVRLHTKSGTYTCRGTMRDLESKLDPEEFIRIHRSVIVNLSSIVEIQPHFHGEYRIIVTSGDALPLGRTYKRDFNSKFQDGL